jgi:hypothetical protein
MPVGTILQTEFLQTTAVLKLGAVNTADTQSGASASGETC